MQSSQHGTLSLVGRAGMGILLFALLALGPAGCDRTESRTLEGLPPPVFQEPPHDWPTTHPDVPQSADDVEAGWRNHELPEPAWRWIVVHHSAGAGGNAPKFDVFHRDTRGWDELGYHFVIGNGTDRRDGEVEVGPRWIKQKHGAHCLTDSGQFNKQGIGICLVGNFDAEGHRPSPRQWASLIALCRFLCREYDIPPDRIVGHRQAQAMEGNRRPQDDNCPGKNVDLDALRRAIGPR